MNSAANVRGSVETGDNNHHLPDEVMNAISDYAPMIPRGYWDIIGDFVRSEVAASAPAKVWRARRLMALTTQLCLWTWQTTGSELTRPTVFNRSNIDRFVNDHPYVPEYKARAATLLLGLTQELTHAPRIYTSHPWRTNSSGVYTREDYGWMRSWAARHTSPEWGRAAHALLGFCLGAGLSVDELVNLKGQDIRDDGAVMFVTLPKPHERVIPIDEEWVTAARIALGDTLDDQLLVMPTWRKSRRDVLTALGNRSTGQRPTAQRCRNTYVVDKLNRGSAAVAWQATGIKSFSSLERYRPFIKAADLDDLIKLSRRGSQ